MVSACMSGTRGSGVMSNTGDVLEMSVVRGVGGVCDMCMCLARGGVGGEGGEWMRELGLGFTNPVGTGGVLDVCLCLDSLCRWQVQVSVYCAWRIPAHLRCTQCSTLLHLMDICFLTCICLWQISHIQTRLFSVVGPGLVSTSPAFVSSSASHPAGPHGRHAQKTVNRAPIAGGGRVRHNLHSSSCLL